MKVDRELSGFSLLEVLIAVVILALALVPLSVNQVNMTHHINKQGLYVHVMHNCSSILNRMLKEVKFADVVRDFGLPSDSSGSGVMPEVIVSDLLKLKSGSSSVCIFDDLGLQAPETLPLTIDKASQANFTYYSYRDEGMSDTDSSSAMSHKIYYVMKIKRMHWDFQYYRNNVANPSADPTDSVVEREPESVMKITLIAGWNENVVYSDDDHNIRTSIKPRYYSLVTIKANLSK